MERLNPFFEVEGKRYEIKRTRAVECEYDRVRKANEPEANLRELTNDYAKLMLEYQEIAEKFKEAKDKYMTDEGILDENLEKIYNAYKKLSDAKFEEVKNFELKNKEFSIDKLQQMAYDNGVKVLIFALTEQCKVTEAEAVEIWDKFVTHFGIDFSMKWIDAMIQTLFESEDEDPFLKQAQARAKLKAEQRKGLSKMRR